jgi:Coenzyme PQQ synthesis protein D (PqqD)
LKIGKPGPLFVKISAQVRSTHNQDGAVVLDILHGQMFRLNLVGSRMLELLKQGHSEARIAEEISREFCARRDIVETDLREFLVHLQKHHLLELGEPDRHTAP